MRWPCTAHDSAWFSAYRPNFFCYNARFVVKGANPLNTGIAKLKQYKQYKQIHSHALAPWLVWGLGATFFFCEYFARVAPSVMVDDLTSTFHVSAFALGALSSFFYFAYVGMQIPVGVLVDRYGPHRLLTIMAAVCAVASFAFARSNYLYILDLSRFVMGFAASFAFVGALKLATTWFPASKFGLLAGLTQAIGMLGAAVGDAPLSFTVESLGWRNTMIIIALIFVALAILIGVIVRDRPERIARGRIQTQKEGLLKGLWVVLKNKQTWINGAFVGMLYAPTAAFAELWGPTFLHTKYGFAITFAAFANSLIFFGWAVGGPLVGFLSDYFTRRKPILIISSVFSLALLCFIIYGPASTRHWLVFACLFAYGIANTGVAISYAVASEINPHRFAGTSVAFANMASVIIGSAFQPLIGRLLDLTWSGGLLQNGERIYQAHDFQVAFIILPACLVLAVVLGYFVKETHCQAQL